MNPIPDKNTPDEQEIEGLLRRFKPRPSHNFYEKMKRAPWQTPIAAPKFPFNTSWLPNRMLAIGLVILLVVVLVGAALVIPPVRGVARQIIFSFLNSPSSQVEVQVTLTSPGDLFDYSNPSNFPLSLPDAQAQAGFQVLQISPLPAWLELIGARFDANYHAVILLYQAKQSSLFLTQRPLGAGQDVFSIGSEAKVEVVKIGNVQGEFVRGGWKAISSQPATSGQTPVQVNISAIWDAGLPQSTLRWQAGNMAFELRSLGENGPSQSDLILWANELK